MGELQYKDGFTLDGRVKPPVGVNRAKLKEMKTLVERTMNGDRIAKGRLEESLTTTDAIFSYAHLTNVNFLPQWERAERTWTQIAGRRTLADFRKPVLYSIVAEWTGLGRESADPNGVSPIIPEGAPYPYAYMAGEEAASNGIVKRGFKTDFTFEAFVNDAIGFISALPGEMLRVALDTEEYEVYGAILGASDNTNRVAGGSVPTGGTVPVNAPLSRDALIRAIFELSQRTVNGRQIVINGGYNLLVPVGQSVFVNFMLNQTLGEIRQGSNPQFVYSVNGYDPLAGITVIETPYVTGTNWYLIPKPGTTIRPIVEHGSLAGHETPELRVENATGTYVGGGAVSPFEGSFDNDSTTFRVRQFGAGIVWFKNLFIWSNGTGV